MNVSELQTVDHYTASKYPLQLNAVNKERQKSERAGQERSTIEVMSQVLKDKARRDDEMTSVRERGRASGVTTKGHERMTKETERG